MAEKIAQDLFASVMRMPASQRNDVLEFLGQSAALPDAVVTRDPDDTGPRKVGERQVDHRRVDAEHVVDDQP